MQKESILKRELSSFTVLNTTQFLGALNDNIYKLLIVYFFLQIKGIEESHRILSLAGAIFVLPFLLFSAFSGTLADRYSKRNIIVITKLFELGIMTAGIFAFYYQSEWASWSILFLLATQSAIFGPSKYGILPEIVDTEKIARANGLMTSFTFLAIIVGTFLASFLLDISGRNFILAAIFCTTVALLGFIISLSIEYTPPSGSSKKLTFRLFDDIYQSLRLAKDEPSLLTAVMGAAFFLFLGAFMQINIIPYAIETLGMTDIQGGYMFLLVALGIGSGSIIAGKISGKGVELGIVPVAGILLALCTYGLDIFSGNIAIIIPLVAILGMFGGIFEIPLDSFIQIASPQENRGQIIGATNFLSFFGVLMASVLLYLITEVFGLRADKGFTFVASMTLGATSVITFMFFDYLTRFFCMCLSRLHFKINFLGQENIPKTPAIYICTHTDWNDTLLLLGAQRRRMRFFIQQEQDHYKWMKYIYRMLRVVMIPEIEPLENNEECLAAIRDTLHRGISVCIFVENPNVCQEFAKLIESDTLHDIFEEGLFPIIPVVIDKGTKKKEPRFFKRLMERIRVPASITFGALACE